MKCGAKLAKANSCPWKDGAFVTSNGHGAMRAYDEQPAGVRMCGRQTNAQ
jgi:hypothetical protein